ncbi:MAG: hypothetical protein OXD30_07020 [Bryobacterales bacterium]|nr:hypothetical protein [Bryobacterales bacterium]
MDTGAAEAAAAVTVTAGAPVLFKWAFPSGQATSKVPTRHSQTLRAPLLGQRSVASSGQLPVRQHLLPRLGQRKQGYAPQADARFRLRTASR